MSLGTPGGTDSNSCHHDHVNSNAKRCVFTANEAVKNSCKANRKVEAWISLSCVETILNDRWARPVRFSFFVVFVFDLYATSGDGH